MDTGRNAAANLASAADSGTRPPAPRRPADSADSATRPPAPRSPVDYADSEGTVPASDESGDAAPEALASAPEGDVTRLQGAPEADAAGRAADAAVMGMLADHVPLSLLLDLCLSEGPSSAEILDEEGCPPEPWWE